MGVKVYFRAVKYEWAKYRPYLRSFESASWIAVLRSWSTTVHLGATRIILFRLNPAQQAEMEVSMLIFY